MTRILLTNDDGIHAPGLALLRRALEGLGEVTTIAPDSDRSAVARGISVRRPLRLDRVRFGDHDGTQGGYDGLAVDGTPVDCVRIALLGELGPPPDLVVSGINYGANMGNDVTYSGTVGAALEAALHRVPGIAVSVESLEPHHLASALPLLHDLVVQLLRAPLPVGTALNVNLPERPASEFAGVKVTSLGGSSCHDRVILESDFEIGGEHWLHCERAPLEPWSSSDFDAIEQGYVSLTPIHYELTSREGLAALAGWMLEDLIESGTIAADQADSAAPGRAEAEAARVRAEAEAAGAYDTAEGTVPA